MIDPYVRVRQSVDKILAVHAETPEVINRVLADIPDADWRNMIQTLRKS